jgi:glycerophosphoryl diester phosphodiesterase
VPAAEGSPVLIAHRGFSARHPEMTKAAYQAAIEWSYETEIPLGLECDVHFSADDELVTLRELMIMVRDARQDHVPVSLVIETKHPNDRGREVEERVAAMLAEFGWNQPDAPIRLISFSVKAVKRFGWLLPGLERTLLIENDLGKWRDGRLPDGVRVVGPDLALIKDDPEFVSRSLQKGHEVHVWTVNEPEDVRFCRDLGVTGFITDYPDRVAAILVE